jgi:hypothetical protein
MTYLEQFPEAWKVDPRIEEAQTLHPEFFRHPDILRAELKQVFTNRWLMLPPVFSHQGRTVLVK